MRLYGKRYLLRKMEKEAEKRVESRDAVLWDVNLANSTCRVKIQGSNELVTAHYPQNWQTVPAWLKPGNAVRIIHKGGVHGYIEVAGHGQAIPSTSSGAPVLPENPVPDNAVIDGCNLIATESPSMVVLARVGTLRFGGVNYPLGPITMGAAAYIMGMGGKMGQIAAAVPITAAPAVGNFRIDLAAIGVNMIVDYIQGIASASPVRPDTPADHLCLGTVLVPGGATSITQANINVPYVAPAARSAAMTIADDELAWTEPSTTITIEIFDQYGHPVAKGDAGGWYVTLEFLSGNGTVKSVEEGSSTTKIGQHAGAGGTSVQFTYTRNLADPGDISPLLKAAVSGTSLLANGYVTLLNASGGEMWS